MGTIRYRYVVELDVDEQELRRYRAGSSTHYLAELPEAWDLNQIYEAFVQDVAEATVAPLELLDVEEAEEGW